MWVSSVVLVWYRMPKVWVSSVVFGLVQGTESVGEQHDVWSGTGC